MKALLIRFALWLVRRLDIDVVEQSRLMNGADAVERGARWDMFYRETGGMADFIAAIRRGYFEAAAGLGVSDTDKLYEYALADRIAREIDRQAQSIVQNGKIDAERLATEARSRMAVIRR